MTRTAINGLGRIGRATLKCILENPAFELVAVNDLVDSETLAYLLKYDTVYSRYEKEVLSRPQALIVGGKEIRVFSEKDPSKLPWNDLKVEIVFECTGALSRSEDLKKHIKAGAKKVILSAPAKGEDVPTIVYGVNKPDNSSDIISTASCTTNCIAPIIEVLGRRIGVIKATMTTVHAYTSTQSIVDGPNKKLRRGRAGAANLVPTSTGAAVATTKALPEYENKFDGLAVRAPVICGSIAAVTAVTRRATSVEEVNSVFAEEAGSRRYKDVIVASQEELVSSDIIKSPAASIIDLKMTKVVDSDLVTVMGWYDNEWGYVNQMIRQAQVQTKETEYVKERQEYNRVFT